MKTYKIVATVPVVLGVLALSYGGFTYTEDARETNLGGLSLSLEGKERVNAPAWSGVGGIVFGGILFAFGRSVH